MKLRDLDTIFDTLVEKAFLWMIPTWLKPNAFTVFRILTTPVIYLSLKNGYLWQGIVLFLLSALTDLIDGALARKRDQITNIGKMLDPIADKLLILSVLLYVGAEKLIVLVAIIYIILEIIAVLIGGIVSRYLGVTSANTFGKIKMWFQVFGVLFLMIGSMIDSDRVVKASLLVLAISLFFAILAGIEQTRVRFFQYKDIRR